MTVPAVCFVTSEKRSQKIIFDGEIPDTLEGNFCVLPRSGDMLDGTPRCYQKVIKGKIPIVRSWHGGCSLAPSSK